MVNTDEFIHRLELILNYYGLSAAAFADKIQVQRSSISHLLSGRNKPSLEFVLKVVKSFPEVNLYWLLNGKGSFPQKKASTPTATSTAAVAAPKAATAIKAPGSPAIHKIIIFYEDGSFKAFDKNLDVF